MMSLDCHVVAEFPLKLEMVAGPMGVLININFSTDWNKLFCLARLSSSLAFTIPVTSVVRKHVKRDVTMRES